MLRRTSIIIAVIALILFAAVSYGCEPEVVLGGSYDEQGNFNKYFDDINFENAPIDSAIALGDDKLAAFEHILSVAITNLDNADYVTNVSDGTGGAYTGGVGGDMTVRSLYIRNPGSFYNETGGVIYQSEPAAGLSAAQGMLNQCRREYYGGDKYYVQDIGNAGSPEMTAVFPFFSDSFTDKDIEEFDEAGYKIDRKVKTKVGEFTNFVFSRDTVKADTLSVTHDDENHYYTLFFELNLEDETARDLATDFPRSLLREIANSDDINYKTYKMTMEVWDNGLLKTTESEESWEGSITVWILSLVGSSHSLNTVYYSWDPDDCDYSIYSLDFSWAS